MSTSTRAAKPFNISDVLSITTGRLVSFRHMEGVYDILNHMTGDTLFTHQLIRASEVCKPVLLKDHPWLEEMGKDLEARLAAVPDGEDMQPTITDALIDYTRQIGCSDINVLPLMPEDWTHIDPLEEAAAMFGDDRVIGVAV